MGSSSTTPILILDDEEDLAVVPPVAAVPGVVHEMASPVLAAAEDSDDDGIERPDWLPDGFEIEGFYLQDGSFKTTGYIFPVSGLKFNDKRDVLDYCFSNGMERAIAAKETLDDKSTLQGKYSWLIEKPGWVLEIRVGGENFNKMFKFYAHPSTRVRFASKDEVMSFIEENKVPKDVNRDCDTSTEDNIIAQLELRISSLPLGWVKETAFRKCNDGIIRKDTFYTDPVTGKVFRSLKSAEQYFTSGKPEGAYVPNMSVTDMYSFDTCTNMLPCLRIRLRMEGTGSQKCKGACQTSCQNEENGKVALHGDIKEAKDEEDWHGDSEKEEEKEEAPFGDGKAEEGGEKALNKEGDQEEDEQEAIHDEEDNNETYKFRSITELYK